MNNWETPNSNKNNQTPSFSVTIKNMTNEDLKYLLSFSKNSSNLVKKYILNKDWQPKHTLIINDWGVKYARFVSDKLRGSEHYYIVWYCSVGWQLKVRMFWKSNSEWCRRAWLWEEAIPSWEVIISKWQSIQNATYETTTKVDYRIAQQLDKITNVIKTNWGNHPTSSVPKLSWIGIGKILINQMNKEVKIDKLVDNYPYSSSCEIFRGRNISEIINLYKNIQFWSLDLDAIKPKQNGKYSYNHKYLWVIDVQIFTTTWRGISIDIHIARARNNSPEKFWIDNIIYSDAKINSFWTYDRQINAAPLTPKPIEYKIQSPKNMELWYKTYDWYVDIRDLYQGNPLIIKCKEVLWMNKS